MCVDYGDSDKTVTVRVTDTSGTPITNATMDVRFYFGRGIHGAAAEMMMH